MIFEVCIDSVEGAGAAQEGGAQRVELCGNLVEGGTTPSLGMIQVTRAAISIELNVIIRPRGGDFLYTSLEFEVMRKDILAAKKAGADGIVIGLLCSDGSVDVERTRALVRLAHPLSVTFHRAIDMCRDADEALEAIAGLGIERTLTSGQKATAFEGLDNIARLVRRSAGRVNIMAGGGINATNAAKIVSATGVGEIHFSARKTLESDMSFHNLSCCMGKSYHPNEYERKATTTQGVKAVIGVFAP
jgi:copper homeostasis protein